MLFRKIVSNLPFSPALLNQLGFYAKRLRKEQATRRAGLLFTALALVVQIFAMMSPPEPALAADSNNIVFNGINTKEDLLNAWDKNADGHGHQDIQQIFKYFLGQDFSRSDLENVQSGIFGSRDTVDGGRIVNLGRTQQTTDSEQKAYAVRDAVSNQETIWSRHLDVFDTGANKNGRGSMYNAFIGDYQGKWFAVMVDCGSIAFSEKSIPPSITPVVNITTTCHEITGFAFDQTHPTAQLKVYAYLDGPPGTGEKYSTTADLPAPNDGIDGGHGFRFPVPVKFLTGKKYNYSIVAMPVYAENDSSQFDGVLDTSNCQNKDLVVQCTTLSVIKTSTRNRVRLSGAASLANGGTIEGYHYTVKDSTGAVVFDRSYATGAATHTTEDIDFVGTGDLTAVLNIVSPQGEQSSSDCAKTIPLIGQNTCLYNLSLSSTDLACQPCPDDPSLGKSDPGCGPQIIKAKTVKNLTQNLDNANGTLAHPGDRLQYELYIENMGTSAVTLNLEENLSDVLEYADLTDFGGSPGDTFNSGTKTFSLPNSTISPGQKISRMIVVNIKQDIPSTPRSVGNQESYDCKIANVFGGMSVTVRIQCPSEKAIENTVAQLPTTGPGTTILFSVTLFVIVVYFYLRGLQLQKELRIVRREFNHGTI